MKTQLEKTRNEVRLVAQTNVGRIIVTVESLEGYVWVQVHFPKVMDTRLNYLAFDRLKDSTVDKSVALHIEKDRVYVIA